MNTSQHCTLEAKSSRLHYAQHCQKVKGVKSFPLCSENGTTSNVHKLKYKPPYLNMRKHLFTVRVVEISGDRLPRGVVKFPW